MDWVAKTKELWKSIRKYRYVLLAALLGIALMLFPEEREKPAVMEPEKTQETQDLQVSLSQLLSAVEGAGKVEVLLTQKEGALTVYQNDEDIREGDIQRSTVLVTDDARSETGLVRQTNPPVWQGAVILCQGADQAQVCLVIVEAVKCATGLSSDRITVLKMK